MQTVTPWRQLLGEIIKPPEERKRLAQVLNVSTITLNRWVDGSSNPRQHKLQLLLTALPQYRTRLLKSLQAEFPTFFPLQEKDERPAFLRIRPGTPSVRYGWSKSTPELQSAG